MDGPTIARATEAALRGGVRVRDTLAAVEAISQGRRSRRGDDVLESGAALRRRRVRAGSGGGGRARTDHSRPDPRRGRTSGWPRPSEHGWIASFWWRRRRRRSGWSTTVEASRGFVYAASTMGVTGARDAVSNAAPELVRRVKAVSDIPVGVGLGVRSREQAAQIGGYADGVIVGSALVSALSDGGLPAVARADRGTGRRCAAEGCRLDDDVARVFPQPAAGRLAPRAVAHSRLRAVHHHRHHRRAGDRRPALGGPRRPARRDLRHRAVGGAVRLDRRPALSPGHRLADVFGPGRRRARGRRCESGTAAWASGARWRSAASARGSAAGAAEFRCRPSATRSPRESSWRRRSAGSATTSTRSSTAGRPRCRGAWRSSTAGIPPGYVDPHSLDGVSTGQVAASCSRRSCTNCSGMSWFSSC